MTAQAQAEQSNFAIQRIYVKDISFESPNALEMFQKEWKPEVSVDLDTKSKVLDSEEGVYEVSLKITVTAKNDDKTAFLVEVVQAGIFTAEMNDDQLGHCLGAFCPNILFPYARETISSMIVKGTFPQLNLAPINFDQLYMNFLANQNAEAPKPQNEETMEA